MSKLKPVTPGEILLEEFLKPMGLSQYRLAKEIGVPAPPLTSAFYLLTLDKQNHICPSYPGD